MTFSVHPSRLIIVIVGYSPLEPLPATSLIIPRIQIPNIESRFPEDLVGSLPNDANDPEEITRTANRRDMGQITTTGLDLRSKRYDQHSYIGTTIIPHIVTSSNFQSVFKSSCSRLPNHPNQIAKLSASSKYHRSTQYQERQRHIFIYTVCPACTNHITYLTHLRISTYMLMKWTARILAPGLDTSCRICPGSDL